MWLSKSVIWRWVTVALIFGVGIFWGYRIVMESRPPQLLLPVFGPIDNYNREHTVSGFKLVNQDSIYVTQDNFRDKIYVADFFFTTCPGICPMMSDQMARVASFFKTNSTVLFLSHTVKPEEDSVPVLKEYALRMGADSTRWFFVTGSKNEIEDLARNSYLVAGMGDTTTTDFVHTQFFALVDGQKRVRGFYDGTDSLEVNKLIADIGLLLEEK